MYLTGSPFLFNVICGEHFKSLAYRIGETILKAYKHINSLSSIKKFTPTADDSGQHNQEMWQMVSGLEEELVSATERFLTTTVKFDEKIETTLESLITGKAERITSRVLIVAATMILLTTLVVIGTQKLLEMDGGAISYFKRLR